MFSQTWSFKSFSIIVAEILISNLSFIFLFQLLPMLDATVNLHGGSMSNLQILISAVPDTTYTQKNIPLKVIFKNTNETENIRILRHFDPLPVFFSFDIVDANNRFLDIPGAGKVDLHSDSIEYVSLSAGENFTLDVNLAKHLTNPQKVKTGEYTVSVTYHNQYGEDCFQGQISSQPISLVISHED